MFDHLEHTSESPNACIYYEISVSVWRIIKKWFNDGRITLAPNNKILNLSKLKEFADENFKSDENRRKFSNG